MIEIFQNPIKTHFIFLIIEVNYFSISQSELRLKHYLKMWSHKDLWSFSHFNYNIIYDLFKWNLNFFKKSNF